MKKYILLLITASVLFTACGKNVETNEQEQESQYEEVDGFRFDQENECWNCGAVPTMMYINGFEEETYICRECYDELIAPYAMVRTESGLVSKKEYDAEKNAEASGEKKYFDAEFITECSGINNSSDVAEYVGATVYFDGSVGQNDISVDENGSVYYSTNRTYIYPENSDSIQIFDTKTYKIADDCTYLLCRDVMHKMNSNGEETGGSNSTEQYLFYDVFNQIIETEHWYLNGSTMYFKEGDFDFPTGNEYMLMLKGEFNANGEICKLEEYYMP